MWIEGKVIYILIHLCKSMFNYKFMYENQF